MLGLGLQEGYDISYSMRIIPSDGSVECVGSLE